MPFARSYVALNPDRSMVFEHLALISDCAVLPYNGNDAAPNHQSKKLFKQLPPVQIAQNRIVFRVEGTDYTGAFPTFDNGIVELDADSSAPPKWLYALWFPQGVGYSNDADAVRTYLVFNLPIDKTESDTSTVLDALASAEASVWEMLHSAGSS